ncbi:MAG: CAP domain-containing protein [Vicingaceae bacterium]|nr:CAP domain-containing protein [Vicingaceae bacterium]
MLLILFLSASTLFAQTSIDSSLFRLINEYRQQNSIKELTWSDNLFRMAEHHSRYLILLNYDSLKTTVSHFERLDLEDFVEIDNPVDRFQHYENSSADAWGETVSGVAKISNYMASDLPEAILDGWKKSPKHNKIVLKKDFQYAGCSIVVVIKEYYSWATPKKIKCLKAFATLDVCN